MADPLLTTTQLGRLLQSARRAQGLTQAAVGARLGLSQKRISAIELDPGTLTAAQLLKLCAVLGLELTLGWRQAPSPAKAEW
ncbi:MAG: helix-turn-helix domain-containing protein [Burkholderiales bacterium]|nr:helix-turn-helix domain-containing protein [Burkholderiales bacterium]